MKKYFFGVLVLSITAQASDIKHATVHLQGTQVPATASNVLFLSENPIGGRAPFAMGMLGESYVERLKQAEVVVAASIIDCILIGVTCLDRLKDFGTGPMLWYQVNCSIEKVVRGSFPFDGMTFFTCFRAHRVSWPYVREFCYHFGLETRQGKWVIIGQVRACPLPPYNVEDHVSYFDFKRRNPGMNLSRWEGLIDQALKNSETRWLDISVEKNRYLLMTFAGKSLLGGLDVNYSEGVSIRIYSWTAAEYLGQAMYTGEMADKIHVKELLEGNLDGPETDRGHP